MAARMTEEDMTRFRGLVLAAMTAAGGAMRLRDLAPAVAELGGWSPLNERRVACAVAARRSLVEDGTLEVWRDLNERNHPEMVSLVSEESG